MLTEALDAPALLAQALALRADRETLNTLGAALRAKPPSTVSTLGRGSSDHAAQYLAYLAMARLGRLVTSLPMSLVTLYAAPLRCDGLLALAFSQSGQSPDLLAALRFIGASGGRTAAIVNDEASPLAAAAQWVLPLRVGAETSIAATKSFIAQAVAGARIVAHWQDDAALLRAIDGLPDALDRAAGLDWSPLVDALTGVDRLLVIGRALGLPLALEMALKLKEVCAIQAEAFSAAEVRHGPMALIEPGYPLLVVAPRGPAQPGLLALADEMRQRGARVLLAAPADTTGAELPLAHTGHEDLDPIAAVQSFYPAVQALARARGLDPDRPRHLHKVTRTH